MTNCNLSLSQETLLITRLRARDHAAYDTLFKTHAGIMHTVAQRFFGNSEDAADAVQDALVSAFKSMTTFEGTARLGTWLHRITVNACLMKIRSRKRARHDVSIDDLGDCVLTQTGRSLSRPADDSVTRAETAAKIRACIDQLPEAYRTVIQLRDLDELDTAETANRLGTNEPVVKTRLHRARHALRELLGTDFEMTNW